MDQMTRFFQTILVVRVRSRTCTVHKMRHAFVCVIAGGELASAFDTRGFDNRNLKSYNTRSTKQTQQHKQQTSFSTKHTLDDEQNDDKDNNLHHGSEVSGICRSRFAIWIRPGTNRSNAQLRNVTAT